MGFAQTSSHSKKPEPPVAVGVMIVLPDVDGKGYTLEATLPFASLGFTPREGLEILFDLAVDDSADGKSRQRQLVWNCTARNSGDRTAWARAVLAK